MTSTLKDLHLAMEEIQEKNQDRQKRDIILDYNSSVERLKSSGLNLKTRIKRDFDQMRKKSA